jgi:hypothetical protein
MADYGIIWGQLETGYADLLITTLEISGVG